jgi:uncharacterized protein (TIGR02687 family)
MNEDVQELLVQFLLQNNTRDRKRKIIFWYDEKQEYSEDLDSIVLSDTEIIKYDSNSFWIRYHVEKEIPEKNVLIYLPFARKKGLDNELLDMESENEDYIFNPDSTTMRINNLGLTNEERSIIKKYERFFKDKKREQRFKEFEIDVKDSSNIDIIVTACLLNLKTISVDEIIKSIIINSFEDEKVIDTLFKFGDSDYIYGLINNYFGSDIKTQDELPMLYKSLIFSYFASDLENMNDINKYSKYLLKKKTNVHVFVDTLMRDSSSKKYFEKISNDVANEFGISELLKNNKIENYSSSDAFVIIDNNIIDLICDSLVNDGIAYDDYIELIKKRESLYWYQSLSNQYNLLKVSIDFLSNINNYIDRIKEYSIEDFFDKYSNELCYIDMLYRKFYLYYDKIDLSEDLLKLKEKIENIYVNDFILVLSLKWSEMLESQTSYTNNKLLLQDDFFENYIKPYDDKKNRVIVIISDAFRFECAKELSDRLSLTGGNTEISYMQGLVPSYTKLGMASLLPHKKLSLIPDSDDILVDGCKSSGTADRNELLKKYNLDSMAIQYSELREYTKGDWKKIFSGKKIVYIYHNTIDNAGEHNENKIFEACDEAINEIYDLVEDLHKTFSGVEVFITADHGFFYRRGKIESFGKIGKDTNAIKQKKRYSYSSSKSNTEGLLSINLDYLFDKDSGYVNIPKGNIIFGIQGSGINYIHGGALPHEIVIPVISYKSTRSTSEVEKVKVSYSGLSTKITNSIVTLDFVQETNVDITHKECRYTIHFEDENGDKISNECIIVANYENADVKDRFFKEKFVFKNIPYDRNKDYYLVIADEDTEIEVSRIKFIIDIAITNNFDF